MLALVLGGGGAKGYAHIGVIKVLEDLGIKPDLVVGTSMGAMIAAFYAAGYSSAAMTEISRKIDRRKKRWLFPLRLSKQGIIDTRHVMVFLAQYFRGRRIEDLAVKYAAVCTDIETGEEVIADRGDLAHAVRASISVPVAFAPHRYAGRLLVDGGFANPVPLSVAQKMGADRIIGVNVLVKYAPRAVMLSPEKPGVAKNYSMKRVLLTMLDLVASRLVDFERSRTPPSMLINVDTSSLDPMRFEDAAAAIRLGYCAALAKTQEIAEFAGR